MTDIPNSRPRRKGNRAFIGFDGRLRMYTHRLGWRYATPLETTIARLGIE